MDHISQSHLGSGDNVAGDKYVTNVVAQKSVPHQLTAIPALGGEFIGRDAEMAQLQQLLESSRRVVLMNGIGGVGKTTLAKWYVRNHLAQYKHVCWIDVTKQDAAVKGKLVSGNITEALADHTVLFNNLNVAYTPQEDSVDQRFYRIANALRILDGPNLLIIDNAGADAGERAIRDQLPQPPQWHVLITSRYGLSGYDLMPLDSLSPEAAQALFHTYYTYDYSPVEVEKLMEAIGYHTLTVELFAKTLEAHHGMLSVGELLQKVQQKQLSDPALKRQLETEHHPEETEVYLHLMLAFDCAELSTDERTLLGQMRLLPPESYTLKDQLAPWLGYSTPEQLGALSQTVSQLVKKGWLNQTKHSYSLHRLIQQVAAYQISFDWEAAKPLVEAIKNLLTTQDNPNALAVYPLGKYGEFLLAAIPILYIDKPEATSLKNNLALIYSDLGRYEEAASLLEQALASVQTHFASDHPAVATSRSNLALVYRDLGRYEEAASLLEQALASDQTHFASDHPTLALKRSNLALVYGNLGRYVEAASLLEQALASVHTHFASDHPAVATSRSNLALVYKDLGRYEEAASLLEQALASDQTHFGSDHPAVATNRSNLALVYRKLGRYEEAASLLEQALASVQTHFGSDHPAVATNRSNLALIYGNLGRYVEAASLLEQALASDQTHFGSNHPAVATDRSNLALVYKDLGRYEEAASLLEQALASVQAHFGSDHPAVATSRSNLALVYKDLGRYEEAVSLMEQALASDQTHFASDHPAVATSRSNLALVYKDLGRYEEAVSLMEQALASDQTHFGSDHPAVATSRSNLALAYRYLGRYEEAVSLLEQALASNQTHFGSDHPAVATDRWNLASILMKLNRLNEAFLLLQQAESTFIESLGEQHPRTINVRSWLNHVANLLNQ